MRYTETDNVPSWAVGKTADEILRMTSTLYDTVQRGTSTPQPTAQAVPVSTPSGVDSELLYRDPAAYTAAVIAAAKAEVQREIQNAEGRVTMPMVSMARTQATAFKPEIWAKYGPEIDTIMAEAPSQARLNVETWRLAVKMVAAEHVDEVAREKAEELLRSGDVGTLRTDGGVTSPASNGATPIRKLFATDDPAIKPYKDAGLNAQDVIAHYAKMGKDETKAAEMIRNKASRRLQVVS